MGTVGYGNLAILNLYGIIHFGIEFPGQNSIAKKMMHTHTCDIYVQEDSDKLDFDEELCEA